MKERGLSYFSLFFPPCEVSASRKNYSLSNRSPYVRVSRTVLNSGFHAVDPDSRYWLQYLSVELGFWVPIVIGILDSLSWILDSIRKILPDSGIRIPLHGAKQHFLAVLKTFHHQMNSPQMSFKPEQLWLV